MSELDELEEIRAILRDNAIHLKETQILVGNNLRFSQANRESLTEQKKRLEDEWLEFQKSIQDAVAEIENFAQKAEQDRIEFRKTTQELLDKIDNLLNGDRT